MNLAFPFTLGISVGTNAAPAGFDHGARWWWRFGAAKGANLATLLDFAVPRQEVDMIGLKLIGGLEYESIFSIRLGILGNNHPNWRIHILFRGVQSINQEPWNEKKVVSSIGDSTFLYYFVCVLGWNLDDFDHDLTVLPHHQWWFYREIIPFYGRNYSG